MSVKIRMMRLGRRHRPFFRINAVDGRTPRNGRILEKLGHYDPIEKDKDKQVVLDIERVKHWLEKGAIASDTVAQMLSKHGLKCKQYDEKVARQAKARAIARKAGKPFNEAERIAAAKAIEAADAAAAEAAKAKEEAAKAKEEAAKAKAEADKAAADAEAETATETEEKS